MHYVYFFIMSKLNSSRALDAIYDPVFTSATQPAATITTKFVPNYANLFSEVQQYPSKAIVYSVETRNIRDKFVVGKCESIVGSVEGQGKSSGSGGGKEGIGNGKIAEQSRNIENVLGHSRALYFKRPMIPFTTSVAPEVLYTTMRESKTAEGGKTVQTGVKTTSTVAIQTDYRESEAQTDPYTPEYIITTSEQPEVLHLAHFKHGKGLPPTLADVEWVERARKKRLFEASLPEVTGNDFELRKQLLQEQELEEFHFKETEIDKVHDRQISLLREALKARDNQMDALAADRVEKMRQQKETEKDAFFENIKKRRIKAMRVISKKRMDTYAPKKTTIIAEYADFGSNVYAPIARKGTLQHPPVRIEEDVTLVDTLSGLDAIRGSIPDSLLALTVHVPTISQTQLLSSKLSNSLKSESGGGKNVHTSTEILNTYKKLENLIRPPTPSVDISEDDEASGIILLQRLLRGRAQQNLMYEGMQRRLQLIHELRNDVPATKETLEVADAAIDFVQGAVVSQTLNTLSMSFIHLREETALSRIMQTAETERNKREMIEHGRRQKIHIAKLIEQRKSEMIAEEASNFANSIFEKIVSKALVHLNQSHAQTLQVVNELLELLLKNVEDSIAEEAARKKIEEAALAYESAPRTVVTRIVDECLNKAVDRIQIEQVINLVLDAVEREIQQRNESNITQPAETVTATVEGEIENADPAFNDS